MPKTVQRRRRMRRGLPASGRISLSHDPIGEVSESVALLEQAVESNQDQIHEISQAMDRQSESMSRQLGELAQTTSRQIREVVTGMEKQGGEFRAELRNLATEQANAKKTNWPVFLSTFGILALLVSAAYQISDLRTQVTMAPVVAKAEISEKDRAGIHADISTNSEAIARAQTDMKVFESKLVEVETQFRLSDHSHNVQFAEQQRMNNILMQMAQGAGQPGKPLIAYPPAPYYFSETTNGATINR